MLIGIVSDSHGHLENTQSAVRLLESFAVEQVLHCGDIGTAEIPALFIGRPTHFVFGNCDYDFIEMRKAIKRAGLQCHERFGELTLAGRRIAVIHSDDSLRFEETINSGRYDLVCYGHTHIAKIEKRGETVVLNPGALYRARPHTIAIVDLETMRVEIVAL